MIAIAVGLWISGLVSWYVIRRQTEMSDELRLLCYQTVAFILAIWAFFVIVVA